MCFTWQEKWEKFGDVLAEKKLTLSRLVNSDMIKPEKFDHLHLVYHFTVPLKDNSLKRELKEASDSAFKIIPKNNIVLRK